MYWKLPDKLSALVVLSNYLPIIQLTNTTANQFPPFKVFQPNWNLLQTDPVIPLIWFCQVIVDTVILAEMYNNYRILKINILIIQKNILKNN